MSVEKSELHCPLCGQVHAAVPLRPGQRASCTRCGTLIVEGGRLGLHGCVALSLTGLLLCLPAMRLPFVTLSKFGNARTVLLGDVVAGLWSSGFSWVGAAVLYGGIVAPVLLLVLLAAVHFTDGPARLRRTNGRLREVAERVQYWAMPEVQVLGVLVAFFKLGDVVDVTIGPGLCCYAGASLFTLLAWRCHKLRPRGDAGVCLPVGALS
ncbi:MAG: Paraquat-inducible protein [Verrucomicrobia bacterium]|nr:Paraquat-inducible protein [Verrucomicrobiota bacterium]